MKSKIMFFGVLLALAIPLGHTAENGVTIIELTQTNCQFLEPESLDHDFTSHQSSDCEQINERTAVNRVAESKTITLTPGKYIFRITNRDVDYTLGFWLRGQGLKRVFLPGVSGGGIETGTTKDYEITLESGEYIYSCPLNPTPDYKLIVN